MAARRKTTARKATPPARKSRSGSEVRKRKALVLSVPPDLDAALREQAAEQDRALSEHVRELLALGMDAWRKGDRTD